MLNAGKTFLAWLAAALFFGTGAAWGQSSPGLTTGQVPTAAQWNSYFASKQDFFSFTPVTSVTCGTGLTGGTITIAGTCAVDVASNSNIWTAAANKIVDAAGLNSSQQIVALTDAATITVNMANFVNASVTLGGNRTLGAPSNTQPGRSGCIFISQDLLAGRTLAYNSVWKFSNGVIPTLSSGSLQTDMLCYIVLDSTHIMATMTLNLS